MLLVLGTSLSEAQTKEELEALKAEKKQIKNLQNQIKRLKEIDLGIEEKKREALPE